MGSFDITEQVTLLTRCACCHKHLAWRSAARRYGYVWLLVCSLRSVPLVTVTPPRSTSWAWAPHHVVCHSYIPVPSGILDITVMWCLGLEHWTPYLIFFRCLTLNSTPPKILMVLLLAITKKKNYMFRPAVAIVRFFHSKQLTLWRRNFFF